MYIKRNRIGSIVNTISKKHIVGYFSSWVVIKNFIIEQKGEVFMSKLMKFYMKGIAGLVAVTILKNVEINDSIPKNKNKIYSIIYKSIRLYFLNDIIKYSLPKKSKYDKLTKCFYESFFENNVDHELAINYFERKVMSLKIL